MRCPLSLREANPLKCHSSTAKTSGYVPPNDSVALAATIAELIRSPETRKRLAAGARKLAENCFSWDRVIESTLEVLNAPFTGQSN